MLGVTKGQKPNREDEKWVSVHKWLCRKRNGKWWVWRPQEQIPIVQFDTYPYEWRPDCDWFLRRWCQCQQECAR
jgi:hypothetical protein